MKPLNLTGKIFGRLTVIEPAGSTKSGRLWKCKCSCGNDYFATAGRLNYETVSCGCQRLDTGAPGINREKTHCPKGHAYSEHALNRTSDIGRRCRLCELANGRKKYDDLNAEERTIRYLRYKYNFTLEDYKNLLDSQGGICASCKLKPAIHVDHDHRTGKVRGMLCKSCNIGLGLFNDEPELLRLAAEYIERTS